MTADSRLDPLGEGRSWWRQLRAASTTGSALPPNVSALLAADQAAVRQDPAAADSWWRLALSLQALGQAEPSAAAFQEALTHDTAPGQVLVLNCERRFLGHEVPIFDALLARGICAHLVCTESETFERALHDKRVRESGGRVSYLGRDRLYAWLESQDLEGVAAVVTATPRPLLSLAPHVRTALVTHDLVGFERRDLPDWSSCNEDARESLARFCAFDLYLAGSRLAQDDLVHRVRFYRPHLPDEMRRRPEDAPIYCAPVGYPKLDRNIARFPRAPETPLNLLLAPTEQGCNPGTWTFEEVIAMTDTLARSFPAHALVLRPHPYDLDRHAAAYARVEEHFTGELGKRFQLDRGLDAIELWADAALLITDSSGTAWNFAFTTLRPVIFHSPREVEMNELYGESAAWSARTRIGTTSRTLEELVEAVRTRIGDEGHREATAAARADIAYHLGESAERSAEAIAALARGETREDWSRI